MIPVTLKLRNFMAYREARLDFQGIHLAVLTGENGAGKSSLLDAITWALWGRARAKRDDELIYLGQSEMEVEYTFDLGGNVYRVIRKRDASRRGRSDLSLQVEDAGGWRTLTETTIRATQQKINTFMRLDYDTFINSAFLLQGRADEFTTKPPGQRKEILGDILGLGIYEIYEQRAKDKALEKEKEGSGIVARVDQIEQELAREPEYRVELAAAQQEAADLNQQLQIAEKEMDALREQHRAINDKQRQLDDLRDRLAGAEADIADTAAEMEAAQDKIDEYRALLTRQAEIEQGLQALQQARALVQDWDRRLQESAKLANRKHELDTAFHAARAEIEANLREIAARIDLLQPKVNALSRQREQLAEAQAELDTLQRLAEQREAHQSTLTNLKEETARLNEQNRQLKVEMDDIKANLTQLEQADSKCPVCQRPLDETHRTAVVAQFQTEGKQKGDAYRANQGRLREIGAQQEALQKSVTEAERQLRGLAGAQGRVARLSQAVTEAEAGAEDLAQSQIQQADLQKRLDNQEFAADVVAALAEVKAELAALGYDEAAHREARATVERFSHFEAEARTVAEAEKRIAEEEKRLQREQTRQTRLLAQTETDRQKITALEHETADLPELITRLNQASNSVDRLQREDRFARDKVAAAKQKLSHVAYLAKQRGEQADKLQQIREVQSIYRELQQAFGKKGVQALLIESAIPEIEDEVNRLLSRMTDSRMHVRFETQREAKSGDSTIETLDIRISDEVGARDYELYSGGEAFRVNFAIRVALSKVLARRAGAQLQTLVIDEGFGTQDGQGRERLVEAINTIQDDFEKIIVITHIDELKDAFPVRIDVWKTPEGSQVAIR
ncbi:MAG: SMC family ATPase [Anaerolineae bacterium]|nr:SMC family ATPase [Anaerolineae bacterium]